VNFIENSDCSVEDFSFNFFYKKKFNDIIEAFKPKNKSNTRELENISDDQFEKWMIILSKEFTKLLSADDRKGKNS
jgi:hypothetical protein